MFLYCQARVQVKPPQLSTTIKGQRVSLTWTWKTTQVYSGTRFSQELISDRAWLMKKVHLVHVESASSCLSVCQISHSCLKTWNGVTLVNYLSNGAVMSSSSVVAVAIYTCNNTRWVVWSSQFVTGWYRQWIIVSFLLFTLLYWGST